MALVSNFYVEVLRSFFRYFLQLFFFFYNFYENPIKFCLILPIPFLILAFIFLSSWKLINFSCRSFLKLLFILFFELFWTFFSWKSKKLVDFPSFVVFFLIRSALIALILTFSFDFKHRKTWLDPYIIDLNFLVPLVSVLGK